MIAYGVMSLLMTATPLAMIGCDFSDRDAGQVIQWHVLGMFIPSFFTGHLIGRFGVLRVMSAGACLLLLSAFIHLLGAGLLHFSVGLAVLGLGWNFLFIGATTLLTEVHGEHERALVQGVNEALVFGTVALTATSSGALHHGARK